MKYLIKKNHRGLSLFEILTSTFVLMVGLLGVLAVLPFGLYQLNRVNKADFGGNCGRAAVREIQVRNWASDFQTSFQDPYYNDSTRIVGYSAQKSPGSPYETLLRCDRPLIFDPLLLELNERAADDALITFPAVRGGLPRLSCTFPAGPSAWTVQQWRKTQALNAFYWKEDRNFAAPVSPVLQTPRPVGVVGDGESEVQSHENYSWLYMLTPQTRGYRYDINIANKTYDGTTGVGAFSLESDIVGYDVDVVVFFNRNTNPSLLRETERAVGAEREGTGFRGGEFRINVSPADAATAGLEPAEMLDMTDIKWVLLSCPTSSGTMTFAKWYRVVNSGAILPPDPNVSNDPVRQANYTRKIMLLGPDVPKSTSYSITLARGAIHVYSSVVKK